MIDKNGAYDDGKHPKIGTLKVGDKVFFREDLKDGAHIPSGYNLTMAMKAREHNKCGGVTIKSITPNVLNRRGDMDIITFKTFREENHIWNNVMIKIDPIKEIKKMTL